MVDLHIEQSSHFVDLSIYNKNFNISDETVLHVYISQSKYLKKMTRFYFFGGNRYTRSFSKTIFNEIKLTF